MGSVSKENSFEFPGIVPSAFSEANRNAAKRAAKTESTGQRHALAPKPANAQSFSSTHKVEKRQPAERETSAGSLGLGNSLGSFAAAKETGTAKKPRLEVMEDTSEDEATEDESAGIDTPLATLAARRTQSRNKVFYPRPQIPRDLGTLEFDFVSAPREPTLAECTDAYFETIESLYSPPPRSPEVTLLDFPELEVDLSSEDEDSIAELKTPSH